MRTLFLIVFVDLVGFGLVIPLLPFYGEHYAASPAAIGLLMASYSLTQFLAAPIWGRMSDRWGRRPCLIASLAGAVGAYLLLAFATSLPALFAARGLAGLMAGNIGIAFAYAADVTSPANRAKAMGLIGAAFGLGFIFGPAIGGVLAGDDPAQADFVSPSLAAAALSAVALVMTVVALPESLPADVRARNASLGAAARWRRFRGALGARPVLQIMAIAFLATLVFAGMEAMFAIWSRRQFGWGPQQNGYLFAFIGAISALIQGGVVGRLSRRFGETALVAAGSLALAAGMVLIPQAHGLPGLLAAMVIVAAGFSLLSPSLNTLLSFHVAAEMRGGAMGVGRSATTLARVVGPIAAGAVFAQFGKDWPFYAGAAVMVVVLAMTLRFAPGLRRTVGPAGGSDPPPPST
jgi:DHA1 family tetracycline resistance protein-like MFS transporter